MFMDDYFSELKGIEFGAYGEYFIGEPADIKLTKLLNIEKRELKKFAIDLFDADIPETLNTSLTNITRGIRAYLQFQDIFDLNFTKCLNINNLLNRHYCYYESVVYLKESVVSILDKNILASITLLRPFLEMSISHLYWRITSENDNYRKYYSWLNGSDKYKESFGKMLSSIFDMLSTKHCLDSTRLNLLKDVIKNIYKSLCSYNHTPRVDESFTNKSGTTTRISYEMFLYVLYTMDMLLKQIVYLYIINYPMSLFPVDGYDKWGFNGPVGLYFDNCSYSIVEKYIGKENVDKLKASFAESDDVKSLIDWYNNFTVYSKEDIEASWKDFISQSNIKESNIPGCIEQRIAFFKAHIRGLGWCLNYSNANAPKQTDISDEIAGRLMKNVIDW